MDNNFKSIMDAYWDLKNVRYICVSVSYYYRSLSYFVVILVIFKLDVIISRRSYKFYYAYGYL